MSAVLEQVDVAALVATAHSVVDQLLGADLTCLDDGAVLDQLQELERLQRRLTYASYAVVAEADARSLPGVYGARSMTSFLRGVLRLDAGEAHARVKAAAAAGPRQHAGQVLAPIFAEVATAQADGIISERHARIIEQAVDALPEQAQVGHGLQVEVDLVRYAGEFDPASLAKIAARVQDCYDPDGVLERDRHREQQRDLCVAQRPDGSAVVRGACTAELAERLLVVFDSLAAPVTNPDGTRDPRTAGQRRHDALNTALRTLQTSGTLPTAGGVAATIVITMSDDAYRAQCTDTRDGVHTARPGQSRDGARTGLHRDGGGLARLAHGGVVHPRTALSMAGADVRLLAVALDHCRGITAYSTSQRLFTDAQRLALAARDGGCSFPSCDVPAGWCEAHHVVDYADGGRTSVDNGTLLCSYHHRHFGRLGWTCRMINGRPHWIPPGHIDPGAHPIRNLHHDPRPG